MNWTIAEDLPVLVALLRVEGITVTDEKRAYVSLLQCADARKAAYDGRALGEIEGVEHARHLFHAIGIDPTKHRPASEALLRRVIKGLDFTSINTLVDVGNWCSLDFLLPICIYDTDKIVGDVTIRKGREGESYLGLNDRDVNCEGRFTVADEKGPFGSPMTDSRRTAITKETTRAILGIFAPTHYDREKLTSQANTFAQRIEGMCGGSLASLELLPA
jgi:DNA/RNA-binding domain of Phe-tRNA-synthetase-like protein